MGWNGANPIFDRVADKLIKHQLSATVITDVLSGLIDELYQGDWDTEDESKEIYKDVPAVMDAFKIVDHQYGFDEEDDD